ncbi:MAG: hypothetical protein JNK58_04105 [Phycisphaerae bacterium]|nr:hypothetical protein [Phycisphaerae bacterium]
MDRTLALIGCLAAWSAVAAPAQAGYMMGLSSGGAASASVLPGDSIELQVAITADSSETHNSAIFRVLFSSAGLRYMGYSWSSPYLNGTLDDDSKPLGGSLPVVLDDLTLTGVGYPAGVVDVELSNVLPVGPNFGSGIIARMTLQVPETYNGAPEVQISLAPDEIALNGSTVSTRTGGFFNLIIPSPSVSAGGFLVAASGLLNRKRRR